MCDGTACFIIYHLFIYLSMKETFCQVVWVISYKATAGQSKGKVGAKFMHAHVL